MGKTYKKKLIQLKSYPKRLSKSLGRSHWYIAFKKFLARSWPTLILLAILIPTIRTGQTHANWTQHALGKQVQYVEFTQSLIQERRTLFELKQYKTQLEQLKQRESQLESERQRLEKELQAKLQKRGIAPSVLAASGSCMDWLRAAGVTDIANAYALIMRESGCDPCKVNGGAVDCDYYKHGNRAWGIPQALAPQKIAHCGAEPICQIKWMQNYCFERYGSWAAANSFQKANNYY